MKYNVYEIHNKLINKYAAKVVIRTESPDQVAEISRDGYMMCPPQAREEYLDLYHIGTFDDSTGEFDFIKKPVLVCSNSVFEAEIKGAQNVQQDKPA